MNMRIFILFSVIIPVFFVSGCGGGETKTDVESTDLLVIKDIVTIPSAELKPSGTVVVRMEVQNVGQTDVWMLVDDDSHADASCYGKNGLPVKGDCFDGDMALVNYCKGLYTQTKFDVVSKAKEGMVCDSDIENNFIELSGKTMSRPCYLKFAPQQIHIFQWTIRAPSEDEIGRLTNVCEFNFQTIYAGKAKTLTYVYFAAPQEVAQRIYTGNDLTLVGDNIASYGPVLANFETGEKQPITAGEDGRWTVYLNLKNLGSGIAKVNRISLGYDIKSFTRTDDCFFDRTLTLDRRNIESELDELYKKDTMYCNIEICKEEETENCNNEYGTCVDDCKTGCEDAESVVCEEDESEEDCVERCKDSCDDAGQKCIVTKKECLGAVEADCNDDYLNVQEPEFDECEYDGCSYLIYSDDPNSNDKGDCESKEALTNQLEIFKTESSRLSCSMTVPNDVVIMQPYKFITTAYYAYSLGRDFKIKTNPYN